MTASEWFSVSLNAILALTGAGRINDSGFAILLLSALSPLGRSSHYAQDSRNATAHTPAAIKEYLPFESWKIPLILHLVPILALFYHEFTSTSIEIPCIIPN